MHAAIHSWCFRERFRDDPSFTIFKALDESAAMGFTSMEMLTGKAGEIGHIGTDTVEGLRDVLAHAQSCGITVHCYSTFNDFAYVADEDWRLANIDYIKQWLRLAAETGVPNIRMLTGYYVEGEDRQRQEELTIRGIEECLPIAEACGVNMAIENHNTIFFQGSEIVDLIKRLGSARLTTCPDPSNGCRNFFNDDCTREEKDAVFENLSIMAPYATNSHLKVKEPDGNDRLSAWDIDRLMDVYRAAGYDGPLTFESVGCAEDVMPSLARSRELVEEAIVRGRIEKGNAR